ncbi:adenylate/guanylate cyclase domain-containing protein [Tunturiibacter lichenicola]|jgi:adenylate cyclase|uniref:adenylate/guanylate cyclase domain-containing protein n=1 Tax=Tunturiibacter lichenicola TaxID=2051959 RepID=UPI003D9B4FAA
MNYSPAIWMVWRMAALIAKRDQTLIEPKHFLTTIFSLTTLRDTAHFEDLDTAPELAEVAKSFESFGLKANEILQRLQTPADVQHMMAMPSHQSSGAAISRSEICKRAFEQAGIAATEESISLTRLRHLAGGFLMCSKELYPLFGITPAIAAQLISSLLRPGSPAPAPPVPSPFVVSPNFHGPETRDIVLHTLDANTVLESQINWSIVGPKFATLCELAWEAGPSGSMSTLLQALTEKILSFIPRATHGAILIVDPITGDLDLKAHMPRGNVSLSKSSALQALKEKKAFIWQRQQNLSKTQFESHLESGVYAPIIADGKSFGVICLNSKSAASRLTAEDLFLAASLGHQIGLVLANRDLKAEVAQKIHVLERLMTNFSPQVRTYLIQRAQAGRLKLGGERSNVSILCADIRGFTIMAASMDTDDLLLLLNDYFAAMVECVFRHQGTIDKFIGDALLVVFGSPEAHPRHAEEAAKASIDMMEVTRAVSERRKAKGERACEIGIGVHTGEVIHGFIGSVDRMEFTIIGDAVNMTTRYCAAAGLSEIIISPQIYEKLWRDLEVEPLEVATKHEGNLTAYKLLALHNSKG